jgi:hypothetical protein
MTTRERRIDDTERRPRVRPGEADTGERMNVPRGSAQELLNAADEIISKALSSDSEAFLKATRQQGGE